MTTISRFGIVLSLSLAVVAAASFAAARQHAPERAGASSHREAPLISEDPHADNTDVYAFVSTETGRSNYVTLIANWIPLQEPANGPLFYQFSDFVRYEINVDTNGDARADLTYRFEFTSRFVDPGSYVYQIGVIGPPPNPGDVSSQYVNLNRPSAYTLTEISRSSAPPSTDLGRPNSGPAESARVLLQNARTAPNRPGPKTFLGGIANPGPDTAAYSALADLAIHTVPNTGGMRVFGGPRDEGFFVDIGTAFDRINPRAPGFDGTSGFNVGTLAIEIPKSRFQTAGDTDGRIGVWATASRSGARVQQPATDIRTPSATPSPAPGDSFVQVSRLANPLFSEFLNRLDRKDAYNASAPPADASRRENQVNPGPTKGPNSIEQQLRDIILCTAVTNRLDQEASWLLGYPAGVVNGFPGNRETQATPVVAEMMRLNFNIPPAPASATATQGVLNGDFAGFPNGRRVTDDTVDILLRLWGGELQDEFGGPPCPAATALTDNVAQNDVPYLTRFPYLGLPQDGYNHTHPHGLPSP